MSVSLEVGGWKDLTVEPPPAGVRLEILRHELGVSFLLPDAIFDQGSWFSCQTGRPLDFRPTHYRPKVIQRQPTRDGER